MFVSNRSFVHRCQNFVLMFQNDIVGITEISLRMMTLPREAHLILCSSNSPWKPHKFIRFSWIWNIRYEQIHKKIYHRVAMAFLSYSPCLYSDWSPFQWGICVPNSNSMKMSLSYHTNHNAGNIITITYITRLTLAQTREEDLQSKQMMSSLHLIHSSEVVV